MADDDNDDEELITRRRSRGKRSKRMAKIPNSTVNSPHLLKIPVEEMTSPVNKQGFEVDQESDFLNESDLILAQLDFENELEEEYSDSSHRSRKRSIPLSSMEVQNRNHSKRQLCQPVSDKNIINKDSKDFQVDVNCENKGGPDKEIVSDSSSVLFHSHGEDCDKKPLLCDGDIHDDEKDLFEDEDDFFYPLDLSHLESSEKSQTDHREESPGHSGKRFHKVSSSNNVIVTTSSDKRDSSALPADVVSSSEIQNSCLVAKISVAEKDVSVVNNSRKNVSEVDNSGKYVSAVDNSGKDVSVVDASMSLKDRLKQRLRQNAGVAIVKRNLEEEIRSEALVKARLDASQIRKEGGKDDIGPFYGLPVKVKELYESLRRIKKLYDWQHECLLLPAIQAHQNLIYTLPTSGGKTLVAEILIMKELLCHQKDALLILPFVSIVQEKVQTISEFATELGFLVEEYAGGKGRFPPIKRQTKKSLYIATMEKGHSLINSLIDTERMSSLGLVIVDELHMIGEGGSRGATLESTLLKLLKFKDVQIVGMSATLNNLQDLQAFMKAEVYHNDFRPVSLQEYVKVEDNIFHVNNKALSADEKLQHDKTVTFPYSSEVLKQDPDHLLGLVLEVIPQHSCLLFCPTKKNCENVAMMLSKLMCNYHRHLTDVNKVKRKELLAELKQNGNGMLCQVLEYTVHFGIAYHHSGLTGDERKVIEEAYANGVLCLLTCTSTLAAGVNLPAKRVILRSPHIGSCFIKYSQYKQMVGRAGRAGIDSSGESILIVKRQDRMKAKDLFAGPQDFCYSSLGHDDGTGVRSLLLSSIGLKLITDTKSAFDLVKSSLLNIQAEELGVDVEALTRDALKCLRDENLILESGNDSDESESSSHLQVTSLGKATFKGAVNHTYSSQLYNDLKQAEESLNLSTHLHLLYLVTPYDAARDVSPDWNIYLNQFCKLSEMELKAAAAVGVPESYINLKASGRRPRKKVSELTVKRFYLTLILWDLWNQRSVWDVADRFSLPRGYVQNLLAQAAAFASCVFHFCQELEEFWAYQDLMQNFVKRLGYCVTTELVPLMEVPGVKLARAKQLFAAGYKTVSQLSFAEPTDLTKHIEHLSLRAARQLICAAKNVLEEKTAVLLEEVENLVAVPGGTLNTGSTEKPI